MARADLAVIEDLIHSTGFFRGKARSLKGLSIKIMNEYGGQVPPDLNELVKLPGVGRKTAERLLVELKDRLNLPLIDTLESSGTASHSAVVDVREALTGLGYSSEEIREVLREQSATDSAENMLRNALNQLGARRA